MCERTKMKIEILKSAKGNEKKQHKLANLEFLITTTKNPLLKRVT